MASMNTILGALATNRKSGNYGTASPRMAASSPSDDTQKGGGGLDLMNMIGGQVQNAANGIVLEVFMIVLGVVIIILVAYSLFKPLLTGIFDVILGTLNGITGLTGEAIKEVTGIMATTLETTNKLVVGTISTATVVINALGVGINATISGATRTLNTLGDGLNSSLSVVTTTVKDALSVSTAIVKSTGDTIIKVQEGILSVAKVSVDSINSVLSTAAGGFKTVLDGMNEALTTTTSTVVGGINAAIEPITNKDFGIPAIARIMLSTTNKVVDVVEGFGETITSAISTLSSIKFI